VVVKGLKLGLEHVKPLSIIVRPQLVVARTSARSDGHLISDTFQSLAEVFQRQLELIVGEGRYPRGSVLLAVGAAVGSLGRLERESLERQSIRRCTLLGSDGLGSRSCHLPDTVGHLRLRAHLALFDLLRLRDHIVRNIMATRRILCLVFSLLLLPMLLLLIFSLFRLRPVNIRYQIILIHLVHLHVVVLCHHLFTLGWWCHHRITSRTPHRFPAWLLFLCRYWRRVTHFSAWVPLLHTARLLLLLAFAGGLGCTSSGLLIHLAKILTAPATPAALVILLLLISRFHVSILLLSDMLVWMVIAVCVGVVRSAVIY